MTSRLAYAPSVVAAILMCVVGPQLVGWNTTVATHYGPTLRADRWGAAGELGLMLAAVLVFLAVMLAFAGRVSRERLKVNALGVWIGVIFLALETYTFSRPRHEDTNGAVVALGLLLLLAGTAGTVLVARLSRRSGLGGGA